MVNYDIYRSLPWFGKYTPNDDDNNNIIKNNFYNFYSEGDVSVNPEYDYHLFKVIKPFKMYSCQIAPAFGFPGGGIQYRSNIKVKDLIRKGFIKEVPWTHTPFFDDSDIIPINGGNINKFKRYKRKTKKYSFKKGATRRKKY